MVENNQTCQNELYNLKWIQNASNGSKDRLRFYLEVRRGGF